MSSMRVITLGALEAAQKLRRAPEIELVRAGDPLDAVAELARPMEDSPADTTVIVEANRLPEDEAAAFVAAARAASPGVTLLASGMKNAEGFDGVWENGEPALRRDEVADEDAIEPGAVADAPPTHGDAEQAHLELFIRGRSSREVTLRMISERLGCDAVFTEEDRDGATPVERRGRVYGWLFAEGAAEHALRREASYLAGWLALEEQVGQLRSAAFVDDLTRAWNRGYFRRHLPRVLEDARAARRDVTLMLYDIDDFKRYNDTHGHGAGDDILRETVRLLQSVIRPCDRVCRIGGDEFAVIFDDPSGARSPGGQHPRSIGAIARRFQRQICDHRFPALADDAPATLTISGGMATFPWDAADAESLVACADRLLLESKRRGKNVITLGPGADAACRVEFPEGADENADEPL